MILRNLRREPSDEGKPPADGGMRARIIGCAISWPIAFGNDGSARRTRIAARFCAGSKSSDFSFNELACADVLHCRRCA